jgi:hypothetical protein
MYLHNYTVPGERGVGKERKMNRLNEEQLLIIVDLIFWPAFLVVFLSDHPQRGIFPRNA